MVAGQVTFFVKLDPATEWRAHAPGGSDGKVVSSPSMSPCTRPSQILSRLLSRPHETVDHQQSKPVHKRPASENGTGEPAGVA
jgi:hypothetical protein